MSRKKRETIESTKPKTDHAEAPAPSGPPAPTSPRTRDDAAVNASDRGEGTGEAAPAKSWARSFKATLSVPGKGVTLGERNGHDWVISFPADPGKQTKDKLIDAGFEYRDRKWKVFTHAANRPAVEAVVR